MPKTMALEPSCAMLLVATDMACAKAWLTMREWQRHDGPSSWLANRRAKYLMHCNVVDTTEVVQEEVPSRGVVRRSQCALAHISCCSALFASNIGHAHAGPVAAASSTRAMSRCSVLAYAGSFARSCCSAGSFCNWTASCSSCHLSYCQELRHWTTEKNSIMAVAVVVAAAAAGCQQLTTTLYRHHGLQSCCVAGPCHPPAPTPPARA